MRGAGSRQWLPGVGGPGGEPRNLFSFPSVVISLGTAWGEVGVQIGFSFFFFPHGSFKESVLYLLQCCFCFVFCFFGLEDY